MNISFQIKLIRSFLILVVLLQLVFYVMAWANMSITVGSVVMKMTPKYLSFEQMKELSAPMTWLGAAIELPSFLLMVSACWFLHRFLMKFDIVNIFSLEKISLLRKFAGAIFLSTCLGIVDLLCRVGLYRLMLGDSAKQYGVGIGSSELSLLLVLGLFFLIINIMHEGRRLAEENEAFI